MIHLKPRYKRPLKNFSMTTFLFIFCLLSLDLAYSDEQGVSSNSCEEILRSLQTVNFDSIYEDAEHHPELNNLFKIYSNRSSEQQRKIDLELAQLHLKKEMSFQVRNPKTGFYDKFVAVPVNGHVAPLLESDFNRLVQSTGPVLRALRTLLQSIYSHSALSIENLGLQHLPEHEAELVLKIIRESIYLEPAFQANQMKDYPFLAVSGFDGAIVDPRRPKSIFFEMNLGTPSGLSNNIELVKSLKQADSELSRALGEAEDDTFRLLRYAIDASAFKWTQQEGLSVVISPGIYNGAHPDVAYIAKHSGMPLVSSRDLYEDSEGNIRLNTGAANVHPIVTGVYNRMEESFFFQSHQDRIAMISPTYADQSRLERQTGLKLRPGAIYKWVYDDQGHITDVHRDANGEPLLEEVWDSMGRDPNRPEIPAGSFARAVLNRHLYVSNLGGRVVDDKRLFRIVAKYLARPLPGLPVASPVEGLSPDHLDPLFENPDQFVIKAPANSGGVGIHFPRTMPLREKNQLLQTVRTSPQEYEVQEVSPIVTLPVATVDGTEHVAIDMRIFIMMDDTGRVHAGKNSILLRTAPVGGLYSNTSRGGGYGIGVILSSDSATKGKAWDLSAPQLEPVSVQEGHQKVKETLRELYESLLQVDKDQNISPQLTSYLKEKAMELSFDLRAVMHTLPDETLSLPAQLRAFAEQEELSLSHVRELFRSIEHHYLASKIHFKKMEEEVVSYKGMNFEKVELAEIVQVDDPIVQKMINFVKENGGEVRLLRKRIQNAKGDFVKWDHENPYFWVNLYPSSPSFLKPVIGVDPLSERGSFIASLAHEIEHFKVWLDRFNHNIASGMSREEATKEAVAYVWKIEVIEYGERRAVQAEIEMERQYPDHPFNKRGRTTTATQFWQKGYVNRIVYPDFQAARQILYKHLHHNQDLAAEELTHYLKKMIHTAIEVRDRVVNSDLTSHRDELDLPHWTKSSIEELVMNGNEVNQLSNEGTRDLFHIYFREACRQVLSDLNLEEQLRCY